MSQLFGIPPDIPEPLDHEIFRLLSGDFEHRPWTIAEITQRIGADPALTLEALIRLRRNWVIIARDDYLILSKLAFYYSRIVGFSGELAPGRSA